MTPWITMKQYFYLFLIILGPSLALNISTYERTCYSAAIPIFPSTNSYCSFVTWNTGNMYSRKFFSLYSPGTALTVASRDSIAKRFASGLNNMNDTTPACKRAVSWLACSTVFPHCPSFSGSVSSVSFLEPCRFQCEQVNAACGFDLDCFEYSTTSCSFYVPQDYVILSPTKGPYKQLPWVYAALIAVWGTSFVLWAVWAYIYKEFSVPKFVLLIGLVFIVRFSISILCRSFWLSCSKYLYVCETSVFGYTIPLLRLLETIQFFAMFLLTRGVAMTRPTLLFSEYFCAIVSSFAFFAVSISVSAFISQAPSTSWIAFTTIIYSLLYSHLLSLIGIQVRNLRGISNKLTDEMPSEIIAPFKEKQFVFKVFFFLLIGFIGVEIAGQCLYALSYMSMESLILTYEVPTWILFAVLAWFMRPRKFSPYYFMLPADSADTAALQEGQNRVLPVIVVHPEASSQPNRSLFGSRNITNDPDNIETEIELSPLLPGHDTWGVSNNQKRLLVLQSGEGEISMGMRGDSLTETRARSLRNLFVVR